MVNSVPFFGPIIKNHYQKTKRNVKMTLYKENKEKIPVINHFV